MRIDALEAFGVDEEMVELWRKSGHDRLLPVQAKAVKECGALDGKNVLVFSPTSSGKTFVGEMAAIRAARLNRRALYLVPQKALAEEKYREFRARYSPFGVRVVISSRDRKEFDTAINRGEFHIAVVVFEKMQGLLVTNPTLLRNVGLVVVDELQMVGDKTRGAGLEILLTKMKMSEGRPQIIGLSAVLGNCEGLANWLGSKLCMTERRPVELRKGVLCEGVFRYAEHNSGQTGEEVLNPGGHGREGAQAALVVQVRRFVDAGEQCLVFCKSKNECVETASAIAEHLDHEPALGALQEFRGLEDSRGRDQLLQLLERRVAYHNADLDWDQREIVERRFREGEIAVICATSTLAMGINLPARNVFIDPQRWDRDKYGRWGREPISVAEYENMSGRAGRLGLEDKFGRAILVTDSEFQAKSFAEVYVQGDLGGVRPALGDASLSQHVLNLVASGLCRTREEVADVLLSSYTGELFWRGGEREQEFRSKLEDAVDHCRTGGLIEQRKGNLKATQLGRLAAVKGVSVETAIHMADFARANAGWADEVDVLEVLLCLSGTEDGERAYFNLSTREHESGEYQVLYAAALDSSPNGARERLKAAQDLYSPDYDETRRAKKTLILHSWVNQVPTRDIEVRFHCFSGSIRGLAAEFAWLAEAFAGVAGVCGWPEETVARLRALSGRLLHGVPEKGIKLADTRVRGLARGRIKALLDAGLDTLEKVAQAAREQLEKLVTRPVAERLLARVAVLLQRPQASEAENAAEEAAAPAVPEAEAEWSEQYPPSDEVGATYVSNVSVHVDGRKNKKRHLVLVDGQEAWLTENSFIAILKLAVAVQTTELGWVPALEIAAPDSYHQVIFRLREQVSEAGVDGQSLIENNAQQQYRLSVPPARVHVDRAMIQRHLPGDSRVEKLLVAHPHSRART